MTNTEKHRVRIFDSRETLLFESCAKLRHAYFVRDRKWVEEDGRGLGLETDAYDASAWHFACFDAQGICAYLRALPGKETYFMLDHEFAPLLPEELRQSMLRQETLELSRLVVRQDLRVTLCEGEHHPIEHLLKALYARAVKENYSRIYIVVEERWPILFARRFGLPFRVTGDPHTFADGTRTVAAQATLEELEQGMIRCNEAKYNWYRNTET